MKHFHKLLLTLSLFLSLSSCLSLGVEQESGYIAGYFSDIDHRFVLRNIDTNKKHLIGFNVGEQLKVRTLPVGRYAIVAIDGSRRNTQYEISIPMYLRTILEIESNSMLFLGDFDYSLKRNPWSIFSAGTVHNDYPIQQATEEFLETYDTQEGFTVRPVKVMTLN